MANVADNPRRGTPLDSADRDRLAALVEARGERAALDAINCSRHSLRSALAGMPIYRVTQAAIRAALHATQGAAEAPQR